MTDHKRPEDPWTPEWNPWVVIGIIIALVLTCIIGVILAVADSAKATKTRPCVPLAHRGVHNASVDENTTQAAEAAAKHGAWLDTDIRITTDGVAYMSHDRNVRRATDGNGRIEDHDSAWVEQLLTEPNGQQVPTWPEFLAAAGDTPVIAELKADVDEWTDAEILAVADAAYGYDVYLGGTPKMLKRINEVAPAVATYWRPDLKNLVSQREAEKRSVDMILAFNGSWTPTKVWRIKQAGYVVGARKEPPTAWAGSLRRGIRLITTDRPVALNNWCAQQAGSRR
jgi:glycerophosphoryl diester phosphodiesterase